MHRILTTHVGSLPRSRTVTDLLFARERNETPVDAGQFEQAVSAAVDEVIGRQMQCGIDILSDGEMSKISYATYIKERISGFDGDSPRVAPADLEAYPSFLRRQAAGGGTPTYRRPRCVGTIRSQTLDPVHADLQRLLSAQTRHGAPRVFMNAASPGVIAMFHPNDFYANEDQYLEALAEAMRPEYEAIADAGIVLQIDSPDLGLGRHMTFKNRSEQEYLRRAERHVEVLNHALRHIPADRTRMHVCWGNYEGPHHCDIDMGVLLPVLLKAKPVGLLFESANPRHGHDWSAFLAQAAHIPDNKVLIPGVIDTTTNFIEHPGLVAERIDRYVHIVGADRVIAGTDCGFSTFAGYGAVDAEIVYAKLTTLAQGAAIASRLKG